MHKIHPIFTNMHAEKQQKFLNLKYTKTKIKFPKQHYNTYKNVLTKQVAQHKEITFTKITITINSSISYTPPSFSNLASLWWSIEQGHLMVMLMLYQE